MAAPPGTAVSIDLLTEAKKIRLRSALGITNGIRNAREFGIVPTTSAPAYHRVQALDGTWSFSGDPGNNTAALINAAYQRAFQQKFSLAFDFETLKHYYLESPLLCFAVNTGNNTFYKQDMPALIGNAGFMSWGGEHAIQFIATHNLPVIITQGGSGFTAENLWIRTLSNYAASGYGAASTLQRFTDHTLWNSPNLRHVRWSPSCCIAVDPFGSLVPSDQRYPGLESYYSVTNGYSSNVNILRCSTIYNRIGVLLGCGVDSNTDGITMRDCNFNHLKYSVVTCHSQTQNILLDRPTISEVWSVLANSVHGGQNGRWPGIVNAGNCSYIANLYGGEGITDGVIHPDWGVTFNGGHSNWEDVGRIIYTSGPGGVYGGTRSGITIRDAQFAFVYTGTPHIKTGRRTTFEHVQFVLNPDSPGQKIWLDNQCVDDLPSNWDTGFAGAVDGNETEFINCGFAVSGASAATSISDIIDFGSLTTGKKNWFKFRSNGARVGNAPHPFNCRGGAI